MEGTGRNQLKILLISVILLVAGSTSLFWGVKLQAPQSFVGIEINNTPTPSVLGVEGEDARVIKVIDGDTIEVENKDGKREKVRYIGVDTPETVDPRRAVGCFGKEASAENKSLIEGKVVILVKDISEVDNFGRKLRYVYLKTDQGVLFINDYLVREGFGRASTYPPDVKYSEQLRQAAEEARTLRKGLWEKC